MSELISFGASFKRIIRFIWLVTINYVHIHWPMWFKDNSIIGLSTSVTQFPYGHFSLWFFSYRFVMNSSVCSNIESQFDQTESQLYSDQNEISLAGHCKFGFDSFFFFDEIWSETNWRQKFKVFAFLQWMFILFCPPKHTHYMIVRRFFVLFLVTINFLVERKQKKKDCRQANV